MTAVELLKQLAVRANNCILKGHYNGDDIHEASELCRFCEKLVDELEKQDAKKETK